MFQQSFAYKLIKNISFPLIVRHDRSIYSKQSSRLQLDTVLIWRRAFFASLAGYFIGKKRGGREVLFSFGFGSVVLLWHLGVDWKLKNEGKYQQILKANLFASVEQVIHQNQKKDTPTQKTSQNNSRSSNFKLKPKLKNVEITTIQELVNSLPREYYE